MKYRIPYIAMTAGGVVGLVASFLQMIEKLTLLSHAHQALVCDLNSYFSCSTVLNAWQSSVFGFPNSMMCMIFFTIFATIGLVGLSGGALPRRLRLGVQTLALFVLAFGLWFLWQSVYSIGSVCVLCLFCFSGLLLVNWSWLRVNADDLPIGQRGCRFLKKMIARDGDTLAWLALALLIALAMIIQS